MPSNSMCLLALSSALTLRPPTHSDPCFEAWGDMHIMRSMGVWVVVEVYVVDVGMERMSECVTHTRGRQVLAPPSHAAFASTCLPARMHVTKKPNNASSVPLTTPNWQAVLTTPDACCAKQCNVCRSAPRRLRVSSLSHGGWQMSSEWHASQSTRCSSMARSQPALDTPLRSSPSRGKPHVRLVANGVCVCEHTHPPPLLPVVTCVW
jgi:hypothetical protein